MTKRLRLTLTGPAVTLEAVVTFTHVDQRWWQATTAFGGVGHTTAGHADERAALLNATRWLRDRFAASVAPGTTTVVNIARAA